MSWIHGLARLVEKQASKAQGKGYGTESISTEVSLVLKCLGKTPVLAIDIGGNVGLYSAELRKRCPELEIHVFEPSAVNIATLQQRFQGDRLIHVLGKAVGSAPGSAMLFSDEPGSGMGSLTKRDLRHAGIKFDTAEPVDIIRFETYWTENLDRRPIDIVKMDIEGHELDALAGFGAALDHVGVLQFEFGGANIDTRTYFRDFWTLLTGRGFTLHRITPFGLQQLTRYRERDEIFTTTNFLAVRNR